VGLAAGTTRKKSMMAVVIGSREVPGELEVTTVMHANAAQEFILHTAYVTAIIHHFRHCCPLVNLVSTRIQTLPCWKPRHRVTRENVRQ
jgi:hypothetical protein